MELNTYFDNVSYFHSVQTAVSISVINFKRPFQFVLQFSTKNKMDGCHIFQEVYMTVLQENRRMDRHTHTALQQVLI